LAGSELTAAANRPIFEFCEVRKSYHRHRGLGELVPGLSGDAPISALDGVSFRLERGRVLGVVGESGSGKSTLSNIMAGLERPTSGSVLFDGVDLATLTKEAERRFHRRVQMVFQDPYASLNPRFSVRRTIEEPLIVHGFPRSERSDRVIAALERSELRPATGFLSKYPHELSGGQRQRVSIARSIVLEPAVLVADEPVSMLDVSVRAGILRLLRSLVDQSAMALLFVTHDLSLVGQICDELMILYRGKMLEFGAVEPILQRPRHPYTQQLIAAVPVPDSSYRPASLPSVMFRGGGELANQAGCCFAPRCPHVVERCLAAEPELHGVGAAQEVACHRAEELNTDQR
jgi:peptide/nickel transport system ATP-binding protein